MFIFSFLAFVMTFGQLALLGACYQLEWTELFSLLALYGSPLYLVMHVFTEFSALLGKSPIYLLMLGYHIFKYFVIFLAQTKDGPNLWLTLAIVSEAGYLAIGTYYLN